MADYPLPPCPTPCDDDCELNPDGCHEEHQPKWKRGHQPWACEDIRKVIGAAVAAERVRLYAELGNEHLVTFTEDRFTVEHSVECKLSGHMHECGVHAAVAAVTDAMDGPDPDLLGRWRITGVSEGLPDLERVDMDGADG